jgi:hypothetical protein
VQEGWRRRVDRVSGSPLLLSEDFRARRFMSSGVIARLSLLVLILALTFPEPADSGFAATWEVILSALSTLWQVPQDIIQRIERNPT